MTRPNAVWPRAAFDLQGHRGARGLAPESTGASFDAAVAAGVTGVELDVRLTRDGDVVVWHDPTLQADKCTFTGEDLTGARVDELSLAQLRTADIGALTLPAFPRQAAAPGSTMLTLDELLERYADRADAWWTIEVKCDPTDPREAATREELTGKVVEAIIAAGVEERSFVHSFDWAVLELAERLDPSLLRSALLAGPEQYQPGSPWIGTVDPREHDDVQAAVAALGAVVLSPHHQWCEPAFVERAHAVGLGVLPWTVNEPDDHARVRAAGVDGLVTDVPDLV